MSNRNLLLDSDVLKKLAAYDLFDEVYFVSQAASHKLLMLGAAPFVLAKAISRSRSIVDRSAVADRLARAVTVCAPLEPTDAETMLAAELEDAAQRLGYPFDAGESLLVAVLATRGGHSLATGDKRALSCLPALANEANIIARLQSRIACLEQVLSSVISAFPESGIAPRVCNEPKADAAVSICFGCASNIYADEVALEALSSYTNHLRSLCNPLLAEGDDLTALLL